MRYACEPAFCSSHRPAGYLDAGEAVGRGKREDFVEREIGHNRGEEAEFHVTRNAPN
jgi:hypothetical protein